MFLSYFNYMRGTHSANAVSYTHLDVYKRQVSKNTALRTLECYINQLTALDVSQNIALTELYCYRNQLTALDAVSYTHLDVYKRQLRIL